MNNSSRAENHAGNVFILTAGILTAAIGFLALLGWILRFPLLTSVGSNLIPTAPSTALLLVLFGAAVFFRNSFPRHRGTYLMSIFIGSLVTVTSLLLFFFSSAGTYPQIEYLGLSITGSLDGIPIGHMSPIVAICFVVSAVSFLLTLSPSVERPRRAVAALVLACVMVLTASLHLIAYSFGSPLMHGGRIIPPSLPASLAFLILALGLLVTAGLQIWPYSRIKDSATARVSYVLFLIFVILAAGIVTGGYFAYRNYEKGYRQEIEHELSAIAELKVNQLVQYRAERLGDASILFKNPSLSNLVRRFFAKANDVDAQHQLQAWLGKYKSHYQYNRVFLLDTLGVTRMSVPKEQEPIASAISNRASEILISKAAAIRDFYRNENDQKIYLSVLVPILDERHSNRPIGILVLVIDPASYLYPLIQYWPTPSRTSESLIIRREGNDALFLNELRFQKNTALTLRSPLTNVTMPAVKAILGKEGTIEGIDHRGVPVLANVRHIPDSPWFLVARMDMSELHAPMRERFWQIILFIGVLLIGTGAGVGFVWRHQRARFYREKFQTSEALRVSEEKYRSLVELLPDGVVVHSGGRIIYANPSYVKIIGAESSEKLIGTPVIDFVHPDYREIVIKRIKQSLSGGSIAPVIEEHLIRLDGSSFTAEVSAVPISYGDKPAMLTVFNDITERKRTEEALRESERQISLIYNTVGDAIFNLKVEKDGTYIFTSVNKCFLSITGLQANQIIGKRVDEIIPEPSLTLVLEKYAEAIREKKIVRWEETTEYPTGRLIGEVSIAPMFDNAMNCVGLVGSVHDITERKRAEEALHKTEFLFRLLFEQNLVGVYHTTLEGNILDCNDAFINMLGYDSLQEIRVYKAVDFYSTETARNNFVSCLRTEGFVKNSEISLSKKNGATLFGLENVTLIAGIENTPSTILGTIVDITERKRTEEALRESETRYRSVLQSATDAIVIVDSSGIIIGWNSGAERIFGFSYAEAVGQPLTSILAIHPHAGLSHGMKGLQFGGDQDVIGKTIELEGLRKDKSVIPIELSLSIWETKSEQFFTGIIRDITERKRLEESLEINESLFHELYDNMKSGSVILTVINDGSKGSDYIIKKMNRTGLTMEGKTLEEIVGKRFIDIRPTIDSYGLIPVMKKVWETGKSAILPTKIYIDERYSNYYENYIFKLSSGEVVTLYNDVTESKRMEENLRESEERFRALAFNTPDHILVQDRDLRYSFVVNPQLGLTEADMVGKTDFDFLGKEEAENLTTIKRKVLETGEPFHLEVPLRDLKGETQFFEGSYIARHDSTGKVDGLIGYFRNITERKRTAEALLKREHQLEEAQRIGHIGSWEWDVATNVATCSDELYRICGRDRTTFDFTLENFLKIPHQDDRAMVDGIVRRSFETLQPTDFDFRILTPNGELRWLHGRSSVLSDETGRPNRVFGTTQDITERKQAEIQIKFQANLLTNVSDAILATDRRFNIQYWNTAAEKQYGWTSAEVLGRHFLKFVQPQYISDSRKTVMQKILQEGSWSGELLHNRSDGTLFPVHVTISEVRSAEGQIIGHIAINRDITEGKRTQEEIRNSHEQLLQLTKHQDVVRENERARISREIHDELGQSLTALKIDLNWVRDHVAKKSAVRQRLSAMVDIVDGTVKDVQRIASELRPSILDDLGLAPAIEWYCEEFEKRSGIVCQTDLEETQLQDPHKNLTMFRILQEALTNIIRHANATTITVHLCRLGENLNLEIKDDGIGMSQEKMISGQSLGLIGMRERARQFNGRLEIVSEGKKGTAIRISLPIHS